MADPLGDKVRVVTGFLDSVGSLDFDAAERYLADDAVMVLPFVDGLPAVHGKAAIVEQLRETIPQMFERMDFSYDAWYDVRDGDAVIAEYRSECPQRGNGGTYRNTYIAVFGFEHDKICLYKEYLNPVTLMAAISSTDPAGK